MSPEDSWDNVNKWGHLGEEIAFRLDGEGRRRRQPAVEREDGSDGKGTGAAAIAPEREGGSEWCTGRPQL